MHRRSRVHPDPSRAAGLLAAGCLALTLASCCPRNTPPPASPAEPGATRPAGDEFSVQVYNLTGYGLADRNGDGQAAEPKPEAERTACISRILAADPDVIALQEIGNPDIFQGFVDALESGGLRYDFREYLRIGNSELNLAVLSRLPILSMQSHREDRYSMGPENVKVPRGFIDVDIGVNPHYTFRLMTAHLKSKEYHPLGQTEMRRNEARLLNNHIRAALAENPNLNLLVAGTMNDSINSAALREITGNDRQHVRDLALRDRFGDSWTWYNREKDSYHRMDYLLVNGSMREEWVAEKSYIDRDPQTYAASDHRPLVAVFRAKDTPIVSDSP